MKSEKKRLHYFAVLSECLGTLKKLILPLGVSFFTFLQHMSQWIGFALIAAGVLLIYDFFKWLRFTYEVRGGDFHIQSGVLIRNDRYIRLARIQSVQIQTNLLLRLIGLVQLRLDTADPADKGDVVLSALSRHEAERVRRLIGHGGETDQDLPATASGQTVTPKKVFRLSGRDFIFATLTSSSIGIIGVLLAFWSYAGNLISDQLMNRSIHRFILLPPAALIPLILLMLLVLWLCSAAVTFFRWGNFRLTVTPEKLQIHKGILETADATYMKNRVQAIRIHEEWLQQLSGFCTIYAECSGSVDNDKNKEGSVLVFPIVRKKELQTFLDAVIPEFSGSIACDPIPLRGQIYSMMKPALPVTIILVFLPFFLSWSFWLWPVLPVALVLFLLQSRSSGYRQEEHRLVFSHRLLAKTRTITLKSRIQTFTVSRSRIQHRFGLGSCSLSIRSSTGQVCRVHQLKKADTDQLFQWFRKE
jgi:Predicted membrane protein